MRKWILILLPLIVTGCFKTRGEIEEQEQQKNVQNQISEIRQSRADSDMKTQTYESELRTLNGRIEVLEAKLGAKQQEQIAEQKESAKQLKDILDQMKIFEDTLSTYNQRIEKLEKPPKTELKQELGEKKKTAWEKAEDLYNKKDWKNAALAYQVYQEKNPKGSNVALAIYKIGVCFQELKMKDDAKNFYEDVVNKYPNTQPARKAKYRLNQMK